MLNRLINIFLTLSVVSSFLLADVFMTELTDPQNSSDAGRYVELYNSGDSDVDLSTGWTIQRWTNGNADPTASSIKDLTGTIAAGGFYIICNDADKFFDTYGLTCDQDIGTGGAADSNGDDNVAILDDSGAIYDMFGVAGEDGTGTGHEFEDGRAERAEDNTTLAKFIRNLESRIYAQMAKSLVESMFSNDNPVRFGSFVLEGSTVTYEVITNADGSEFIRMTIISEDGTETILEIPIGSGNFGQDVDPAIPTGGDGSG